MTRTDAPVHDAPDLAIDRISVKLLRWPEESDRVAALAGTATPCLLLVAEDAAPPPDRGPLTDWIRVPAEDLDLWNRIAALQWRARMTAPPRIDDSDLVWRGRDWVALSPIEAAILRALFGAAGAVVSRRALCAAGWPGSTPSPRSVDAYIKRLRRRIEGLGLRIHTVRSRGYLLEVEGSDDVPG